MLKPEDGFLNWEQLFIVSLEEECEFRLMINDFVRLVGDYGENGHLLGELEQFTQHFGQETLYNCTILILKLTSLPRRLETLVCNALCKMEWPLLHGLLKQLPGCEKCLICLFSEKAYFYRNENWSYPSENYRRIIDYFRDEGPLNLMIKFVTENPRPENLQIVRLVLNQCEFSRVDRERCLCELQDCVFGIVQNMKDNLKATEPKQIEFLVLFISSFIGSSEVFRELTERLLDFCGELLRCDVLAKQLLGAQLVVFLYTYHKQSVEDWAAVNLLDWLRTQDAHERVLAELSYISDAAISRSEITPEILNQFFAGFQKCHSSQKTERKKLVFSALAQADPALRDDFVSEILTNEDADFESVLLLVSFAGSSQGKRFAVTDRIIMFILQWLESDRPIEVVKEAIDTLTKASFNLEREEMICHFIQGKLADTKSLERYYPCYEKLLLSVSCSAWIGDIMEEMFQRLSQGAPSVICQLLEVVLPSPYHVIQMKDMKIMVSSDQGWKLLGAVLKEKGLRHMNSDTVSWLLEYVAMMDMRKATVEQYSAIEELLLSRAADQRKVTVFAGQKSISEIQVKDPNIDGLNAMINLAIFASSDISNKALTFLLTLWKNSGTKWHSGLIQFTSQRVEPLRHLELSDGDICERQLKLVNAFLKSVDILCNLDYSGLRRHKENHRCYISCSVNFEGRITPVSFPLNLYSADLYKLVGQIIGRSQFWLKCGDEWIRNETQYLDYDLAGKVLEIYDVKRQIKVSKDSMASIFSQEGIVDKFFSWLMQGSLPPNLAKQVWTFLMFMPTVQSVVGMSEEELVTRVTNVKGEMEMRYLLQYARQAHFISLKSPLLTMLTEGKVSLFALSDAIAFVKDEIPEGLPNHEVMELGGRLWTLWSDSANVKRHASIEEMIIALARHYPEAMVGALIRDLSVLKNVICTLNGRLVSGLKEILTAVDENSEVFDALIPLCQYVERDKVRFPLYLELLASAFNSDCKGDDALVLALRNLSGDDKVFSRACRLLSKILLNSPDRVESCAGCYENLLQRMVNIEHANDQMDVLELMKILWEKSVEFADKWKEFLKEELTNETLDEVWNYDPSDNFRNSAGFLGLRNLGATCYMNAVIQQLFWNIEFRNAVLTMDANHAWKQQLVGIFARMQFAKGRFVDTERFAKSFSMQGNQPINPRIQQDALEFFQILLDKLEDKFYKGTFVSVIEPCSPEDDMKNLSTEPFWSLLLELSGRDSFEQCIDHFLQKETITGYPYNGRTIDVRKFTRVKEAPKYVVLALKRFALDLKKWTRVKINDALDFPDELQFGRLMETDQDIRYKLTGVIVHAGAVDAGHYISYIRIADKWYKFDDRMAEIVEEAVMKKDAIGGKYSETDDTAYYGGTSAYVLFYSPSQESDCEPLSEAEVERFKPELLEEIKQENAKYAAMQFLHSKAFAQRMLSFNDPLLSIDYFLHVFVHSSHGGLASAMSGHVINLIQQFKIEEEVFKKILSDDYVENTVNVLITCSNVAIVSGFMAFLNHLMKSGPISESVKLVSILVKKLDSVSQSWRPLRNLLEIICVFALHHLDIASEQGWPDSILEFVIHALKSTKSTVFKENCDFSRAFELLAATQNKKSISGSLSRLWELTPIICEGYAQVPQFMKLVCCAGKEGLLDVTEFCKSVACKKNTVAPVLTFIHLCSNEDVGVDLVGVFGTKVLQNSFDSMAENFLTYEFRHCATAAFCLITLICPNRSEQQFLTAFPAVEPLEHWFRADKSLDMTPRLVWEDCNSETKLGSEDYNDLTVMMRGMLHGIGHINVRPELYFKGNKTWKCLCPMLRVLFWMIIRLNPVLTSGDVVSLLDLFETLHKVKIRNDCNRIELLMVLSLLARDFGDLIANRFDDLVKAILDVEYTKWTGTSTLVFNLYQAFASFLAVRMSFFVQLLKNSLFQSALEISDSIVLDRFLELALKNGMSTREFVLSLGAERNPKLFKSFMTVAKSHSVLVEELPRIIPLFIEKLPEVEDSKHIEDCLRYLATYVGANHVRCFGLSEKIGRVLGTSAGKRMAFSVAGFLWAVAGQDETISKEIDSEACRQQTWVGILLHDLIQYSAHWELLSNSLLSRLTQNAVEFDGASWPMLFIDQHITDLHNFGSIGRYIFQIVLAKGQASIVRNILRQCFTHERDLDELSFDVFSDVISRYFREHPERRQELMDISDEMEED